MLAFPPFGLGVLGFAALVPLHFACRGASVRTGALAGLCFGLLGSLALFSFLLKMPSIGVLDLLLLALWLSLFSAVLGAAWSKLADHELAVPLLPAIAIALDWLRGHSGFLSVPLGTIGQTQHANVALLQLASIGGEHLVAFVVVAANVALAQLLARRFVRRTVIVLVAVVLDRLTRQASEPGADLVVWPEGVAGDIEHDELALFRARAVVENAGAPVLVGAGSASSVETASNSLTLMVPDEPARVYIGRCGSCRSASRSPRRSTRCSNRSSRRAPERLAARSR